MTPALEILPTRTAVVCAVRACAARVPESRRCLSNLAALHPRRANDRDVLLEVESDVSADLVQFLLELLKVLKDLEQQNDSTRRGCCRGGFLNVCNLR